MIPKIIHYCWFGRGEIPELVQRCMASWHRFMPDWTYMCWNEDNFDVASSPIYVQQAYEVRKYAFVSDYVRLWALEQYGGVYLDTDVEVIRPFDALQEFNPSRVTNVAHQSIKSHECGASILPTAFIGFEESRSHVLGTCVIGAEPFHTWITDMIKYYDTAQFFAQDDGFNMTANTIILSQQMEQKGLLRNGKEQMYGDVHVYTFDYFSPITSTRVMKISSNTYCIHHFAGSWQEKTKYQIVKDWIRDYVLGPKLTDKIVRLKRVLRR